MQRNEFITEIVSTLLKNKKEHTTRVAIDGITASGKTTLANEIVEAIKERGFEATRISLDGFIDYLLKPLGENGDGKIRTQILNLENDEKGPSDLIQISKDSFIVVDGSFSLRKELYPFWDFSMYLKVDFELAQQRSGVRDKDSFGSSEKAIAITRGKKRQSQIHHLEAPFNTC